MPRKTFDGPTLAADRLRLSNADQQSPPTERPCLMDVVRTFEDFINTRAKLKWDNPMIAAVITAAGYPISADTLRSYRARLARTAPSRPDSSTMAQPLTPEPASITPAAGIPNETPVAPGLPAMPTTRPPATLAPIPGREPPAAAPARRTFAIDPTTLRPDRA